MPPLLEADDPWRLLSSEAGGEPRPAGRSECQPRPRLFFAALPPRFEYLLNYDPSEYSGVRSRATVILVHKQDSSLQ